MKLMTVLMAIPLSILLMAMPLGNNAKAAIFLSFGAAPAYYYPAAPVTYAPPPVAYVPPSVAYPPYPPQYIVQPAPVVYAAPAAVVAPLYIGGGWYHHCCWH